MSDKEKFLEIYNSVYRNDPKAFAQSESELAAVFLALPHTKLFLNDSARAFALFNPEQKINGKSAAYFGFFEALDDIASVKPLLDDLSLWAKELGAETLWGPINFSTFGNYRIRLDGFNRQPFYGEPWNPPYYQSLLSQSGFTLQQEYVSYFSNSVSAVKKWAAGIRTPSLLKVNSDLNFLPLTAEYFETHKKELWQATNEIFQDNLAFQPLSQQIFEKSFGAGLITKICPYTSLVVEHNSGEIAGYCINFPDYSSLIKKTASQAGKDYGEINFRADFAKLSHPILLVKTAGLKPKFRNQGFPFLQMILEVIERGTPYESFCLCLMRLGNFPSLLMKGLVEDTVRYGLFAKDL